jgi:hypothetical protein
MKGAYEATMLALPKLLHLFPIMVSLMSLLVCQIYYFRTFKLSFKNKHVDHFHFKEKTIERNQNKCEITMITKKYNR